LVRPYCDSGLISSCLDVWVGLPLSPLLREGFFKEEGGQADLLG
jgi:hypothetical protein